MSNFRQPSRRRVARTVVTATASAALVVALAACSAGHHNVPGPARGPIDLVAGSYGGVFIGEGDGDVLASVGAPEPDGMPRYITPNDAPPYLPADSARQIVYPDMSVISVGGRVTAITVYGLHARTGDGLQIGEPMARARATVQAVCQRAHGGQQPRDPNCQYRARPGLWVYFAGDPVAVIAISQSPVLAIG